MPGNDFEKQVQQKMDELQFVPSDAVWPAVEREIKQKKKRRFIIWLPIVLLLMCGAGFLYFSNSTAGTAKQQTETAAVNKKLPYTTGDTKKITLPGNAAAINEQPVTVTKNGSGNAGPSENIPVNKAVNKNKIAVTKQNAATKISEPIVPGKINSSRSDNDAIAINNKTKAVSVATPGDHSNKKVTHIIDKKSPVATNSSRGAIEKNNSVDEKAIAGLKKEGAANNEDNNIEEIETVAEMPVVVAPSADSIAAIDALAATKSVVRDSVQNIQQPDSSKDIAKNRKPASKKKIDWGVTINGGVSSISNGFSGIFSGSQTFDASSFSGLQTRPSNNNNATAVAPPSDVHAGFAYGLGVFVRKPLGKGFSLLAGVNYNYYSTTMQVGAKIDTGANAGQYRTGSASKYTNKFHFIELPLMVQKQLGKKSRFAVNGGLSLSLLAANSVLLYDAQKSNYGTEQSYINKIQVNLLAGFSYRLFPSSLPIEIGPQLRYSISNIYQKEIYGSRHLFFTGLQAKVFFGRK